MKLGIMHPSVLARGLDDLGEVARRGITGVQAEPSLFLDERGRLREPRARSERRLQRAALEVPAWSAYRSLVGPPADVAAAIAAQKRLIDLAARFRHVAGDDATPIVCTDTGRADATADPPRGDAWDQLLESTAELTAHAEKRDVVLAIEPARDTLLRNSFATRSLLDAVLSDHLGVCFDPAGICGDYDHLGRAIDLLSDVIVLLHAGDVAFGPDGAVAGYAPAGKGQLDYAKLIALCADLPACNYLILKHLGTAQEAGEAIALVSELLSAAPS